MEELRLALGFREWKEEYAQILIVAVTLNRPQLPEEQVQRAAVSERSSGGRYAMVLFKRESIAQ